MSYLDLDDFDIDQRVDFLINGRNDAGVKTGRVKPDYKPKPAKAKRRSAVVTDQQSSCGSAFGNAMNHPQDKKEAVARYGTIIVPTPVLDFFFLRNGQKIYLPDPTAEWLFWEGCFDVRNPVHVDAVQKKIRLYQPNQC